MFLNLLKYPPKISQNQELNFLFQSKNFPLKTNFLRVRLAHCRLACFWIRAGSSQSCDIAPFIIHGGLLLGAPFILEGKVWTQMKGFNLFWQFPFCKFKGVILFGLCLFCNSPKALAWYSHFPQYLDVGLRLPYIISYMSYNACYRHEFKETHLTS